MEQLRIGVLGAARIAPAAIIRPARVHPDASVTVVAARDRRKAERFAAKHGVPRVVADYEAVLADDEVDAVYIPLPNGLHHEWTLKALAAGKHVLCEKPFTSNATEAEEVAAAAGATDLVVMEAFHYRYHPVAARMIELANTAIGEITHIESSMVIPLPLPNDIRYRYDLAGGALMDVGCYALHMQRSIAGEEPTVTGATAKTLKPQIDRWARVELRYASGATGTATCALLSGALLRVGVKVTGTQGTLKVFNPTGPHMGYRMTVTTPAGKQRVRVEGAKQPTYSYQLDAFVDAVLRGEPTLTPPSDSVATMRLIDAAYQASGLQLRGT